MFQGANLANMDVEDTYQTIRKLRKKLRQIEHLERLDRDLSNEEVLKVSKKDTVRSDLLEGLSNYSDVNNSYNTLNTDSYNTGPHGDGKEDLTNSVYTDLSTSVSEADIQVEVPVPSSKKQGQITLDNPEKWSKTAAQSVHTGIEAAEKDKFAIHEKSEPHTKENRSSSAIPEPSPKKSKKTGEGGHKDSKTKTWRNSQYEVVSLDSHSDLITAVDINNDVLVSASRDTTVKVWDLKTLTEVRNLGGHTGSVTDVLLLSPPFSNQLSQKLGLSSDDGLIVSASVDCSFRVWCSTTGELLRSVYTYNAVTKVCFLSQLSLVVTASDGGKLELWDVDTKQNIFSLLAHQSAITGLCTDGEHVYSSSMDGEIRVHEVRDTSLVCVFVSENLKTESGRTLPSRHIKSLCIHGNKLLFGDDGVNIKDVSWKKGLVKKIGNHGEDFGMTDALYSNKDMVVASAYDLDNGFGYINVFSDTKEKELQYSITLSDGYTGRIIDVCCTRPSKDSVAIVTAGSELKVWRVVSGSESRRGTDVIAPTCVRNLTQPAVDSDIESDIESSDQSSGEDEDNDEEQIHADNQSRDKGWTAWCTML